MRFGEVGGGGRVTRREVETDRYEIDPFILDIVITNGSLQY